MIRIKQEQVAKLIATVYAMSVPVGMGHLHYKPGELDKDTHIALQTQFANNLASAKAYPRPDGYPFVDSLLWMDYIHGRQCKFRIGWWHNELCIADEWYDHNDAQFDELLNVCGVDRTDRILAEEA